MIILQRKFCFESAEKKKMLCVAMRIFNVWDTAFARGKIVFRIREGADLVHLR